MVSAVRAENDDAMMAVAAFCFDQIPVEYQVFSLAARDGSSNCDFDAASQRSAKPLPCQPARCQAPCQNKRGPRVNSVKPAAVSAFDVMTKSVANTVTVLVIFSSFACA